MSSTSNASVAASSGHDDAEDLDVGPRKKRRRNRTRSLSASPSASRLTPAFDVDLSAASTRLSMGSSTASHREAKPSANVDEDLYTETGRLQRKSAAEARQSGSPKYLHIFAPKRTLRQI
jgi:hypothetical protein